MAQWLACWAHNPKVPGSKPGSAIHVLLWEQETVAAQEYWQQKKTACSDVDEGLIGLRSFTLQLATVVRFAPQVRL